MIKRARNTKGDEGSRTIGVVDEFFSWWNHGVSFQRDQNLGIGLRLTWRNKEEKI